MRLSWLALFVAAAAWAQADSGSAGPADDEVASAPELEAGERAYARCAVCHGEDGRGREDGTFPRIAGQHGAVVVAQLRAIRNGDRPNPIMEPHARALLDERQMEEVAAYVNSLRPAGAPGLGPGDDLERGGQLYRSDCAGCHGAGGQGDAAGLVPAVAGQHYAYLLRRARNLGSWRKVPHPREGRALEEYTDAELRAVVDFAGRLRASALAPE